MAVNSLQILPSRKGVLLGPCVVTHTCNPSYLEVEMGKIMIQGQPRQKLSKTPSQPIKFGAMVHACHTRYMKGINRRLRSRSAQPKAQDPI
jgi:hypothetical protein